MAARLIAVLVLLGAVLGGIFAWKHYQATQSRAGAGAPPPATVGAAEVTREAWERGLDSVGSLVAVQGIYVTTEVAGQVASMHFRSGQRVERGMRLLELDASVDRADLAGLEAEARLAEVEFLRATELLQGRNISRSEYDRARAQLEFAQAKVEAKRAQIAKKSIRAPFAGRLGIELVDVGEYLAPGARIVLLQRLDPIHVDYTLPERHLDLLSSGLPVEVRVQAYPGETFTGRVSAIDPGVDPGTRAIRIRASFGNESGRLRPGMFAEVRTLLARTDHVLTLPRTAISFAPYGDSVFAIQQSDAGLVAQRRPVTTGDVRGDRVEIVEGLAAGDRVVSVGHQKLRNGQPIRIDDSAGLEAGVAGS